MAKKANEHCKEDVNSHLTTVLKTVPVSKHRESNTGYLPPILGTDVPVSKHRESKTGYFPLTLGTNVPVSKHRESRTKYPYPRDKCFCKQAYNFQYK